MHSLAALGACKGASPQSQCEDIYKKGDGEKAYATDKAKFIDVCTRTNTGAGHAVVALARRRPRGGM
ncbi:MAG TPA: hypothetical protein VLT45_17390 [Kofleriaceae bacterium]|nr:hypothetical protein [Kofleriaceae bacterium]